MNITLYELNESWGALKRLADERLPKEKHKLAYKLSKLYKQVKAELDDAGNHLNGLMAAYGFVPGQQDVDPKVLFDYNEASKLFLKTTSIMLTWDNPIKLDELDSLNLSSSDLADLSWLIEE